MKRTNMVALLSLIGILGFSQHTVFFDLSGVEPLPESVQLYSWNNGNKYLIKKQSVLCANLYLEIPDSVPPSMLGLVFTAKSSAKDLFIIYTRQDAILKVEMNKSGQPAKMSGTGETPFYDKFNFEIDSLRKRIAVFQAIVSVFGVEDPFSKRTQTFFINELKYLDSVYQELNHKFEGRLFLRFLNAGRNYIPDPLAGREMQQHDVLKHFFDYFNPMDSVLLNSPIYDAKVRDYLAIATGLAEGNNEKALQDLMDVFFVKTNASLIVTGNVARLMRPVLNQLGYDETLEYIDEKYLALQCRANEDPGLQERLVAYKRLAVGNPAPEIIGKDEKNNVFKLSDTKAEHSLIIFWATSCEYCRQLLPQIDDYLKEKPAIQVIAIALDDENSGWETAIKNFPGWTHLRATGKWNNEWIKCYGVNATPTIFILDKDLHIQGKIKTMEDLKQCNLKQK